MISHMYIFAFTAHTCCRTREGYCTQEDVAHLCLLFCCYEKVSTAVSGSVSVDTSRT